MVPAIAGAVEAVRLRAERPAILVEGLCLDKLNAVGLSSALPTGL